MILLIINIFTTELPLLNDLKVSTGNGGITIHYSYEILEQSPEVKHIEWRKNGQPIDFKIFVGGSLNEKSLTIISPAKEGRGKYSCTVTNAVGSVSKEIILGKCLLNVYSFLNGDINY